MALCSPLHAVEWAYFATVSDTLGINTGRVCVGDASKGDIGCPTYAPTVSSAGLLTATTGSFGGLTVTGSVSATNISASALTVNGVAITGGGGVSYLTSLTDVSSTGTADNRMLRYSNSSGKWEAVGINEGLSTTTIFSTWPDAISCVNGTSTRMMVISLFTTNGAYYELPQSNGGSTIRVVFDRNTQAYDSHQNMTGYDCLSKSISQLYADGQAFNFIGGSGSGGGTPGGSDTQIQFNNSSAFGGSANFTWTNGYNRLTATNISGTTLTATTTSATTITAETVRLSQSSAACSGTSDQGKMRRDPTTGRLQICLDR